LDSKQAWNVGYRIQVDSAMGRKRRRRRTREARQTIIGYSRINIPLIVCRVFQLCSCCTGKMMTSGYKNNSNRHFDVLASIHVAHSSAVSPPKTGFCLGRTTNRKLLQLRPSQADCIPKVRGRFLSRKEVSGFLTATRFLATGSSVFAALFCSFLNFLACFKLSRRSCNLLACFAAIAEGSPSWFLATFSFFLSSPTSCCRRCSRTEKSSFSFLNVDTRFSNFLHCSAKAKACEFGLRFLFRGIAFSRTRWGRPEPSRPHL